MPNPDGIVQAQDLCLEAVTTPSIAPAAVTTTKIANLAVGTAQIGSLAVDTAQINTAAITKVKVGDQEIDIQRMLNPVDIAFNQGSTSNASWTTAVTTHGSTSVDVPSWAGTASIRALSQVMMESTGTQTVNVRCTVAGTPTVGALAVTATSGQTVQSHDYEWREITSPGATVAGATKTWLSASVNSTNYSSFRIDATFLR